ncbi:MAG: ATP-binding protein [Oscillospiraceae bacterium]|jgi:predicted AAA+ superfamily ATPase|nr:ATP-binding protein [Oscillospiraceae bacterium]
MREYIQRPEYLSELIAFRDKELIKAVTGIRRSGKSTLFELYILWLKAQGVEDRQIIHINLESPEFSDLTTYKELYHYVLERLQDDCQNYIFIDEVQAVKQFEKAVDGLYIRKNCDVYITGSNAHLLSGELATLLSGRYVEIKMLPLSFKEYLSAVGDKTDLLIKYRNYLENSSFPYALALDSKQNIRSYLSSLFDSILLTDIVERKRIADVAALKAITRFAFDNIGNITSATSIAGKMATSGRKTSVHTVENYLGALCESYVLYRADRFDVKGKQQLETGAKYYVADIGLRYNLLGNRNVDAGHILENVVYLELLRRGYHVYVGKVGNAEVDFIAIGEEGESYYQVAYTVIDSDGKTLARELAPLDAIRDHNPKYLLTMDFIPNASHNGIKQINVLDWLLA